MDELKSFLDDKKAIKPSYNYGGALNSNTNASGGIYAPVSLNFNNNGHSNLTDDEDLL